jgi:Domain of unknown function (DUF3427)
VKTDAGSSGAPGHIFLLVTLDKVGHATDFQYKDHFVTATEFEWQSQNRTGHASADGQQPVVKLQRRTETGEAPRWQGATTENTGSI